jgi:3-oxoacyl-[acyl-carrier-protein] synthase-3
MRWDGLYLAALGAYLPEKRETATAAVAAGQFDPAECDRYEARAVAVAGPDEPPPDMAVWAARRALERGEHRNDEFALLVHASMYYQGRDLWTPAHYVQQATIGGPGVALDIYQAANGGLAALELAAAYLTARTDGPAALITCADSFPRPGFDRWRSDSDCVFGDGAAAVVLSRDHGPMRLLSTVSTSVPELEPVFRGTSGWTAAPHLNGGPVDLRQRKLAWLAEQPDPAAVFGRLAARIGATIQRALGDAGVSRDAVDLLVHANLARPLAESQFHQPLGFKAEDTTYEWGRDVGHVGGADQLLGLDHLVESGRLRPGQRVLLVGVGMGFTCTAAVVEMTGPDAPGGTQQPRRRRWWGPR